MQGQTKIIKSSLLLRWFGVPHHPDIAIVAPPRDFSPLDGDNDSEFGSGVEGKGKGRKGLGKRWKWRMVRHCNSACSTI
jgi:hypothetical protein